jgi:molybdate transport system ATP-binding protein
LDIERLRDEAHVPIVYVSHSLAEVSRLATAIVVLRNGCVAAIGSPAEVLSRTDLVPEEVMEEAGAVIEARISEHDAQFGLTTLQSEAGPIRAPHLDLPIGTAVRVRIRARDIMIANVQPRGLSALNVLPGTVIELKKAGETLVEVGINCSSVKLWARLTQKSVETLGLQPGLPIYAILKSVALDKSTLGRSPSAANFRGASLGVRIQDESAPRAKSVTPSLDPPPVTNMISYE